MIIVLFVLLITEYSIEMKMLIIRDEKKKIYIIFMLRTYYFYTLMTKFINIEDLASQRPYSIV